MAERTLRYSVRCKECEMLQGNRRALMVTNDYIAARALYIEHRDQLDHHLKLYDRQTHTEREVNVEIIT